MCVVVGRGSAAPESTSSYSNYTMFPISTIGDATKANYTLSALHLHHNDTIVPAHLVVLTNPIGHFSFEVPVEGGCANTQWTSQNARERDCLVATNAGFFNVGAKTCIGNVVANGSFVQLSSGGTGGVMANFGLTRDGNYVVGYLTSSDLLEMGVENLVSGVGWLVREGLANIESSIKEESIQASFVYERAPRIVIGHDVLGRLMILEVDGNEIEELGPNLLDLTAIALKYGFYNAVNLDGGGSTTLIYESILCVYCGVTNATCGTTPSDYTSTYSGGGAAHAMEELRRDLLLGPSLSSHSAYYYYPCSDCGIAVEDEDGAHRGEPSDVPSTSGRATRCQRQVTTITCIR